MTMPRPHDFLYADLLKRNASLYGDAPALIGDFPTLSHIELYARCQRLAGALQRLGLYEGDRIALLAPPR